MIIYTTNKILLYIILIQKQPCQMNYSYVNYTCEENKAGH